MTRGRFFGGGGIRNKIVLRSFDGEEDGNRRLLVHSVARSVPNSSAAARERRQTSGRDPHDGQSSRDDDEDA